MTPKWMIDQRLLRAIFETQKTLFDEGLLGEIS